MKPIRAIAALFIGLSVSACANIDVASRNAPLESQSNAEQTARVAPSVSVKEVRVSVPKTLKVSEANLYYPIADIVWRGDARGDRHAQVKAIFDEGFNRGAAAIKGKVPVVVDVEVLRFHSLTEKTRYTIGGVHSITFNMTLRDPKTNAILVPTRKIKADLKGYGGSAAVAMEARGETQKVRITRHLAGLLQHELMTPAADAAPVVAQAKIVTE